jgi:chromosome partitioning protein
MEVLTVIAEKGGVGRTTLCANLAGGFNELGKRVLLVDMEGQASLTKMMLGPNETKALPLEASIAALFDERLIPDPNSIIQPTTFEGIAIAPSSPALAAYNDTRPDMLQHLHPVLRDFLAEVREQFDIVIVDTPPGIKTIIAYAAIVASDFVLIPVEVEPFGMQAIPETQGLILTAQQETNRNLQQLGLVVSKRQRTALQNGNEKILRNSFQNFVFETVIRQTPPYAEANQKRVPITSYKLDMKARPKPTKADLQRVDKASNECRMLVNETLTRIEATKEQPGRKVA